MTARSARSLSPRIARRPLDFSKTRSVKVIRDSSPSRSVAASSSSRSQRKEVRVYKLTLKDVNQQLFRLTKGATVALN